MTKTRKPPSDADDIYSGAAQEADETTHGLKNPALFKQAAYVGGEWVETGPGEVIEVLNPATGEALGKVPGLGAEGAEDAVKKAHAAFGVWRNVPAGARAELLTRWASLMAVFAGDLARLMTLEQGKPLDEALGEIRYAAGFLSWFAGEAERSYGRTIPTPDMGQRLLTVTQPVGVAAAITPWNFPSSMITRKAGAALAAGCTLVVKPASQTPFSALALAELSREAGIPPGVFNVVTGEAEAVGGVLATHPLVRKLTFTGSTEVGRLLLGQAAQTVKRVSMELGGNAPVLVLDDADLDRAVSGTMAAKFRNGGQTCVCANRIYVQNGVAEAFEDKLAEAVAALTVGNGLEPLEAEDGDGGDAGEDGSQGKPRLPDIGPLIDSAAVETVEAHIADAVEGGAEVRVGGALHALGGTFFQPTLLTGVARDARLTREETFGPVAPVIRFDTLQEGVELANDSEYGLAAYAFTSHLTRAIAIYEALEAGMVGINTGLVSTPSAPFGGVKQSGLGREGGYCGIDEFLETKYVCISL